MTDQNSSPHVSALQELEAALEAHRRTQAVAGASTHAAAPDLAARFWGIRIPAWRLPFDPLFLFDRRHPVVRNATIAIAGVAALVLIGGGALWWRLASGPIILDLATPWLTSAIEQNLGSRYRVKVGGTQLERDAQGHTALRLRDIVLRDAAGALVAVAPKAEVGLSGASFLVGKPARRELPAGRRQLDNPHRSRRAGQCSSSAARSRSRSSRRNRPRRRQARPCRAASIAAPSAVSPNASKNSRSKR